MQVTIVKSTVKAHLVQNAAGQQAWIQARWLKADGTVSDSTFIKGALKIQVKKDQDEALKAFKNEFHAIQVARESEKAVAITVRIDLCDIERDITRLVWLPKSQLKDGAAPGWLLLAKRAELRDELRNAGSAIIEFFGGVEEMKSF